MSNVYSMIPVPQAQQIVLDHCWTLGSETIPSHEAVGRVLSVSVVAPDSLPPFPASIKDGYAVISSDGIGTYNVVGESRAGSMDSPNPAQGTVVYITTGAPVPLGFDAVVQVEDTEEVPSEKVEEEEGTMTSSDYKQAGRKNRRVRILKAASPGQDIRVVGSDILVGETVLRSGEVIGVAEIGILATVGATHVTVYKQPHVGVMSTGDEVVEPSTSPLGPGQIRDANRSMILAAAAKAGAKVTDLGIARDTEGHIQGCFDRAVSAGVDVLITSGGVSMGDRDLVKPLLERTGTIHFGRVLMKPGKPLTFATLSLPSAAPGEGGDPSSEPQRSMMVFGLPGNPVSSFACFYLTTLPALRKLMGWSNPMLRRVQVKLAQTLKMDPERPEYHRVALQWSKCPFLEGRAEHVGCDWWAVSTGNQISSRLLSARSANALLEVPQASGFLRQGTLVSAILIDDLQAMPDPDGLSLQ
ncbi:hypothetical protein CEUSTIGMA_g13115.t1 [Chlamydomonas eustigma]|uniref:Molybdopterin biosynthesis protein CNX1 n=1 Tax=Chlamydomonas eustigma TaxID=1157962 RepID=A0A250XRI9_9CHLO|nr:hypothetical protein CEUSTIGMA_g13115.t1 [Chlamydomonas eustigma]|eukprot:GAX85701.1 hypothetical protein CEUSTIGMA_g13115.t1 [Chlamydomonas eustigma]